MLLSLSSFVDLFKYAAQLDNAMVGAALVAYIEKWEQEEEWSFSNIRHRIYHLGQVHNIAQAIKLASSSSKLEQALQLWALNLNFHLMLRSGMLNSGVYHNNQYVNRTISSSV
jgi:hypothetical protein